jgi:hypothetical protein
MKLSAIAGRGAARDFWDLHTLVTETGRPLGDWMDAFRTKFPSHDVGHLLRSLVYFGDADAAPLPEGLTADHWTRIQRDFQAWVPALVTQS